MSKRDKPANYGSQMKLKLESWPTLYFNLYLIDLAMWCSFFQVIDDLLVKGFWIEVFLEIHLEAKGSLKLMTCQRREKDKA